MCQYDNMTIYQLLNLSLPVPSLLPVRTQTSEPETEPETRNSEPGTRNPEPETRNPNSKPRNYMRNTLQL